MAGGAAVRLDLVAQLVGLLVVEHQHGVEPAFERTVAADAVGVAGPLEQFDLRPASRARCRRRGTVP